MRNVPDTCLAHWPLWRERWRSGWDSKGFPNSIPPHTESSEGRGGALLPPADRGCSAISAALIRAHPFWHGRPREQPDGRTKVPFRRNLKQDEFYRKNAPFTRRISSCNLLISDATSITYDQSAGGLFGVRRYLQSRLENNAFGPATRPIETWGGGGFEEIGG